MSMGGLESLNVWAGTITFVGPLLVVELDDELDEVLDVVSDDVTDESLELIEGWFFVPQPDTKRAMEVRSNNFLIFICLIIAFLPLNVKIS